MASAGESAVDGECFSNHLHSNESTEVLTSHQQNIRSPDVVARPYIVLPASFKLYVMRYPPST